MVGWRAELVGRSLAARGARAKELTGGDTGVPRLGNLVRVVKVGVGPDVAEARRRGGGNLQGLVLCWGVHRARNRSVRFGRTCPLLASSQRKRDDGRIRPSVSRGDEAAREPAYQRFLTKYFLTVFIICGLSVCGSLFQAGTLQCFLVSWAVVATFGRWAVPKMGGLKQSFQGDGPDHATKEGTPTAGGIFFVPIGLAVGLAHAWPTAEGQKALLLGVVLCTLCCGIIGAADDYLIVTKETNRGLSPRVKLLFQAITGFAFCFLAYLSNYGQIREAIPVLKEFRVLYLLSSSILIAGESNAVNLTDGVDGLASGLFAIAAIGLAATLSSPPHLSPSLALLCAAMSGACCGFLEHNGNPAKVFMGDTGSLALGAFLASVAVGTGCILPFLLLTMVFNLEMLSVILQVGYFKWTKAKCGVGRRFFKMAPFHHHLERCSWSERSIVLAFYAFAVSLLAGNLVLSV